MFVIKSLSKMNIEPVFKKLLMITIFVCAFNFCTTNKKCKSDIKLLMDGEVHFLECIMSNVTHNNFTMCAHCKATYDNVIRQYDIVKNNCSEYIGDNSVDVIHSVMQSFTNIWEKAYCPDCFVDDKYAVITDLYSKFMGCSNTSKNNSFCLSCLTQYETLNSYYIDIELNNKGKVCFDMHSLVNETRIIWSACSKHEGSLFLFILASSFVCCLPVIFYGVNIILTKRNERNHGVLFNSETEHRINSALSTPFPIATATATTTASETNIVAPNDVATVNDITLENAAPAPLIDYKQSSDNESSSDEDSLFPNKKISDFT